MWDALTKIVEFLLSTVQQLFNLYMTVGLFSAVFAIWLVRKVLKTFNLI